MKNNLVLMILYLLTSNVVFAQQSNMQNVYSISCCFVDGINDETHRIITPQNKLITGFLVEIKNDSPQKNINITEDNQIKYFNSQDIKFYKISSATNTSTFNLIKDIQDQNFYVNFGKFIFWLMLNRRDNLVTIRPVISNQEAIADNKVLYFDKSQLSADNNTKDILDPENIIVDKYDIQLQFPAEQKEAKWLFNQFKGYISKQRLIYSNLDLQITDFNTNNLSSYLKIEFNKAGTQLMRDYAKSLIWLLLNHGNIYLESAATFYLFDKNKKSLMSIPDTLLYAGKKTEFNQYFSHAVNSITNNTINWYQPLLNYNSKLKQQEVLDFWFAPELKNSWLRKQQDFVNSLDQLMTEKFANDLFLLVNGFYDSWLASLKGKLAYIILADQFPRNIYRGSPMIIAYDKLSLRVAMSIIENGDDKKLDCYQRIFCYLPLTHSENIINQNLSVELLKNLLEDIPEDLTEYFSFYYQKFIAHKIIIDNFGRFLHRDKILFNIKLTAEESEFMEKNDAAF